MAKEKLKLLIVFTGALLFNSIFWNEKLGLNALLFAMFILASVFYFYPQAWSKSFSRWLALANIISALLVIINNSLLSKFTYSATLFIFIGFAEYCHRSVLYALFSTTLNYVLLLPSILQNVSVWKIGNLRLKPFVKAIKFFLLPLAILFIFFNIYLLANTIFQQLTNDFINRLQYFLVKLFQIISMPRIVFTLFGFIIIGGMVIKSRVIYFEKKESRRQDNLLYAKEKTIRLLDKAIREIGGAFLGRFMNGMLALKNENKVGLLSIWLLNILLLAVNIIDIIWVWFGFNYSPYTNLSGMVHQGANLLIFSIILAMMVLLFFFRGNLNFYKKNKWLKYGAYCWLLQNGILAISVFIRDYYYIYHMGLAYKRIGVLIFLLLTVIGLYTMFIKIYRCKSIYYLFKVNAWGLLIVLIVMSSINWDVTMARYNINHKNEAGLDVNFLLSLSDKALPVLDAHPEIFRGNDQALQKLSRREKKFMQQQQQYSWLSWNWADAKTIIYFNHHPASYATK